MKGSNYSMAIFVVLWSHLLTNKLSYLQKNNYGHANIASSFDDYKLMLTCVLQNNGGTFDLLAIIEDFIAHTAHHGEFGT